jgi:hypothetical protein
MWIIVSVRLQPRLVGIETKAIEEISFELDTDHAYPHLVELAMAEVPGNSTPCKSDQVKLMCRLEYAQSTLVTNNCQALLRCRAVVVNDLPTLRELTKNECEETMWSLPI